MKERAPSLCTNLDYKVKEPVLCHFPLFMWVAFTTLLLNRLVRQANDSPSRSSSLHSLCLAHLTPAHSLRFNSLGSSSRKPSLAPKTELGTSPLCSKYPTYNWIQLLSELHYNYLCVVDLSPQPNCELFSGESCDYSLLYLQSLAPCLAHSRSLVNICE